MSTTEPLHTGAQQELRAGGCWVTRRVAKSARIDTSALKRALPEVAERFTARRFCVARERPTIPSRSKQG